MNTDSLTDLCLRQSLRVKTRDFTA